jgi:hypothetical protein
MHRRAFLSGLIAAPLVAASANLMPLRGLVMPLFPRRWLLCYDIVTDAVVARCDVRSDGIELPRLDTKFPVRLLDDGVALIEKRYPEIVRNLEKRALNVLPGLPGTYTQLYADFRLDPALALELVPRSYDYNA